MMVRRPGLSLLLCTLGLSYAEGQERTPNVAATPAIPVLDFPEPGLDDPAAYQGYQTRFYRDSRQNTVQVYLDPRGGRVVTLWADAANESAGFTVRDAAGRPARLTWGARAAAVAEGKQRSIEYRLVAGESGIELGGFLLGTMRVERDYQYAKHHLQPLSIPPFRVAEESLLVADVARLPSPERERHLALLGATSVETLRSRLGPTLTSACSDTVCTVRVERPSLDGRNHLSVEVRVDPRRVKVQVQGERVSIRTRPGSSVRFAVKVATDAAPLTPLRREEIFNPAFLKFLENAAAASDGSDRTPYRRMERQVRAVELLSSKEKLLAGLPNFATYFGRDMMMTALMMRPIWTAGMSEHVIASVLRKLGPDGPVSHEEALGGQAIRENAVVYDSLITGYLGTERPGQRDSLLGQARSILGELQKTRENYHMIDDEFQLPVLTARYLGDSAVSPEQKRAFLLDSSDGRGSRLALILKEMALVASWTRPYAEDPRPTNLVSFPKRDSTHWRSASWRDSDAGYAGGRFAMDVNAIWAPQALQSIATILATLGTIGITPAALNAAAPDFRTSVLGRYAGDSTALRDAIDVWRKARQHFEVTLTGGEVRSRVRAKLARLPAAERRYWEKVVARQPRTPLTFLALSLDSAGTPIPVVSTDIATALFLEDLTPRLLSGELKPDAVLQDITAFTTAYPIGLFVGGLGPLVANDAYASREIGQRFENDRYHGPRVVWGREVNLLLMGIANQMAGVLGPPSRTDLPALKAYVQALYDALGRTRGAVHASGLDYNELWSYQIEAGRLRPVRYGTSSDIQLWSTTTLAVQFMVARLALVSF